MMYMFIDKSSVSRKFPVNHRLEQKKKKLEFSQTHKWHNVNETPKRTNFPPVENLSGIVWTLPQSIIRSYGDNLEMLRILPNLVK